MNPEDPIYDPSFFAPFLNLSRLYEVYIRNIHASHNFMIEAKGMSSLFTIQYCSKLTFEDITFEKNWLDAGALSIFLMKEYLPFDFDYGDPDLYIDTYYNIRNVYFGGNRFGKLDEFNALIIVKAISWVNINFENVTVEKSDFIFNSFILELEGFYDYTEDYDGRPSSSRSVPIWGFDQGSPWFEDPSDDRGGK